LTLPRRPGNGERRVYFVGAMKTRLAMLAAAVLGVGVLGLHGEDKEPKCDDRFGCPSKDALKEMQNADKDQLFTCLSEVLTADGTKKKTFVWVLHNDKLDVVLYAKWDDAGMPAVSRHPLVCRMVSNDTLAKDRVEKKSLVVYGPKGDKNYQPQTFVMADPKPQDKDKDEKDQKESENADKEKDQPGMLLESKIISTTKDSSDSVDVRFSTETDAKGLYTYKVANYGKKDVSFSVPELSDCPIRGFKQLIDSGTRHRLLWVPTD
jgi:hypothetical protein